MSVDNVTVFVSESISDKIAMDQFYDNIETQDVNVTINTGTTTVSGRMISLRVDSSWNSSLSVKFVTSADDVSKMMFSKSIESIDFTSGTDRKDIKSFNNVALISQQFDIDYKNNQCIYEFIFEMHNI